MPSGQPFIITGVDVATLTALLADRLAAIVPPGFHVEAADGGAYGETEADNLAPPPPSWPAPRSR